MTVGSEISGERNGPQVVTCLTVKSSVPGFSLRARHSTRGTTNHTQQRRGAQPQRAIAPRLPLLTFPGRSTAQY